MSNLDHGWHGLYTDYTERIKNGVVVQRTDGKDN